MVYWNPRVFLSLWKDVENGDWDTVNVVHERIAGLMAFLPEFSAKGFTDTAFDRLGGLASGFLKTSLRSRGPYPSVTKEDIDKFRRWCVEHFPQLLDLGDDE